LMWSTSRKWRQTPRSTPRSRRGRRKLRGEGSGDRLPVQPVPRPGAGLPPRRGRDVRATQLPASRFRFHGEGSRSTATVPPPDLQRRCCRFRADCRAATRVTSAGLREVRGLAADGQKHVTRFSPHGTQKGPGGNPAVIGRRRRPHLPHWTACATKGPNSGGHHDPRMWETHVSHTLPGRRRPARDFKGKALLLVKTFAFGLRGLDPAVQPRSRKLQENSRPRFSVIGSRGKTRFRRPGARHAGSRSRRSARRPTGA